MKPTRTPWRLIIPSIAVALATGAGAVYVFVLRAEAPAALTFADTADTAQHSPATATPEASAPGDLAGSYLISAGSQAGYRVGEVLFGEDVTAVGRTSAVTGDLIVAGTAITAASFSVDMTQIASDQSRRDGAFQNRVMDTATFPTASFTLTDPIDLGAVPADLEEISASATGELTVRGITQSVTFDVTARRNADAIEVDGSISVVFADFGVPDIDFGPAQVDDAGDVEFLLVFQPT